MKIKEVRVQDNRGSCYIYIPKIWATELGIEKGSKMVWILDEGDHQTLHLKHKGE